MSDEERRGLERAIRIGDPDARAKLETLDRRAPPPELLAFDRALRALLGPGPELAELNFWVPEIWVLTFVPSHRTRVIVVREGDDLLIAKVTHELANDLAAAMLEVAGMTLSVVPGSASNMVRERVPRERHVRVSVAILERWFAWSTSSA